MAGRPRPEDLLFAREVAEILGYAWPHNVYGLKGLPEPIKEGPGCKLWWRPDIERYARERRRGKTKP